MHWINWISTNNCWFVGLLGFFFSRISDQAGLHICGFHESACACVWHAVVTELLAFSAPLSTTALIRVVTEILSQSACSQMALARFSPVFQMSVKNWRGDAFSLSPLLALPPLFLPVWPCVKKLSGKSKYGVAISPKSARSGALCLCVARVFLCH